MQQGAAGCSRSQQLLRGMEALQGGQTTALQPGLVPLAPARNEAGFRGQPQPQELGWGQTKFRVGCQLKNGDQDKAW